jgi:hypothetical protein
VPDTPSPGLLNLLNTPSGGSTTCLIIIIMTIVEYVLGATPSTLNIFHIVVETLTPRTLEEEIALFRTRSQHIGSLSSVVCFSPRFVVALTHFVGSICCSQRSSRPYRLNSSLLHTKRKIPLCKGRQASPSSSVLS